MSGDEDEPSEFERAMRDVRRLAKDARRAATPRRRVPPSPPSDGGPASRRPSSLHDDPSIVPYSGTGPTPIRVTRIGARLEGLGDGANPRLLVRLRRGAIPADEVIDLHGLTRAAAERQVIETILAVQARGGRCVRIVHGRGQRSQEGRAVLREALPDWLHDPRVASRILAVCSAGPAEGGDGATWVHLRRMRRG